MQESIQQIISFLKLHSEKILVGILVVVIVAILKFFPKLIHKLKKRRQELKKYYEVIWKKSSKLTPEEVLGLRGKEGFGFNKSYFRRPVDNLIERRFAGSNKPKDTSRLAARTAGTPPLAVGSFSRPQNVLVIGNPLAGKTRVVYELLKHSKKKYDVTILKRPESYTSLDLHIPLRLTFWRKRVLVLDDINKFATMSGFAYLLNEYLKRNVIILATCRTGIEYEMLCRSLERELEWFGKSVEISKLSKEEKQQVEQQLGKALPERFDGNIGSIFVDIKTMRDRFNACTTEEKGILRSLKRLHAAGIYRGRELFSLERLKLACDKLEGIQKEKYEWRALIDSLIKNGFVGKVSERPAFMEKVEEQIQTEETYLEQVIEDDFSPLDNLREMLGIFSDEPDALYDIGRKAREIGLVDLAKADYMKVSIEACQKALEVWNIDSFPDSYAMTQDNLGIAYGTLAEVENKADNCRRAITAYQEALKVRTLERFPMDYGMTQNNLGNAFRTLAEVENKADNCRRAITAHQEALKVYALDRLPMQYGATQNNLGNAFRTLAEVENKADNCRRAITAYQEALKVRTLERFPMQYGATQNNLGNAFRTLAEVENKADNCQRAIEAYQEALKVYTLERFPMNYGMTQNNLGGAYTRLAEVEDKADNCKQAIAAYHQALKVRTLDRFPMDYATTQNNLGAAYRKLAEVDDKTDNCKKAKRAYEEALKVYTEDLPEPHAVVMRNLGRLYRFCEDVF